MSISHRNSKHRNEIFSFIRRAKTNSSKRQLLLNYDNSIYVTISNLLKILLKIKKYRNKKFKQKQMKIL